jgi:hypothetical protein
MRAAFVTSQGMNLIDDDRLHAAEMLATLRGGEQKIQ